MVNPLPSNLPGDQSPNLVNPINTQSLPSGSFETGPSSVINEHHNHPFYLHPSDSPGMLLVNALFNGNSYGAWRRAMFIAMSAKNKLGLIDGIYFEPNISAPLFQAWNRCNDMVISWLLNSLSREIVESVIYSRAWCCSMSLIVLSFAQLLLLLIPLTKSIQMKESFLPILLSIGDYWASSIF